GDDKRVLIWKMEETLFNTESCPTQLGATHLSNIFAVKWDNENRRIISAGNDEQILVHDVGKQDRNEPVDSFIQTSPIYAISVDPLHNEIFASASDLGSIHIYDLRTGHSTVPFVLAKTVTPFHSVVYNTQKSFYIATANSHEGIALYDIRNNSGPVLRYGISRDENVFSSNSVSTLERVDGMSVCFNYNGTLLYALRRRLPPVLYKLNEPIAYCQFDADNYFNSCTMKTGCFAGDRDQYVVSGSDDFNVYVWKIPTENLKNENTPPKNNRPLTSFSSEHYVWDAHLILRGHRSVVNQVRFTSHTQILVSSGVEKIIKSWTPFSFPGCSGNLDNNINSATLEGREIYSHDDYIQSVFETGVLYPDYSQESIEEDKRMIAFFDSLVQRELDGNWTPSSDDDDDSSSNNDGENSISTDDEDKASIVTGHRIKITELEENDADTEDDDILLMDCINNLSSDTDDDDDVEIPTKSAVEHIDRPIRPTLSSSSSRSTSCNNHDCDETKLLDYRSSVEQKQTTKNHTTTDHNDKCSEKQQSVTESNCTNNDVDNQISIIAQDSSLPISSSRSSSSSTSSCSSPTNMLSRRKRTSLSDRETSATTISNSHYSIFNLRTRRPNRNISAIVRQQRLKYVQMLKQSAGIPFIIELNDSNNNTSNTTTTLSKLVEESINSEISSSNTKNHHEHSILNSPDRKRRRFLSPDQQTTTTTTTTTSSVPVDENNRRQNLNTLRMLRNFIRLDNARDENLIIAGENNNNTSDTTM
ncbi:unnamed protein product, partial [Didymodactylos carnosus]